MPRRNYSGDTGSSPDDTDDAPRPRAAFTPRARRDEVMGRAIQLSELAFGDGKDALRFIDEATGELNWERYEKEKLTDKGFELVAKYDYRNSTGRTVLFEKLRYQHKYEPKLKVFVPRHYEGEGNRKMVIGIGPVRVPYHLPELLAAG
jgi:hypothetical protein